MIPIRDTTPCKNHPIVNISIIAANVIIYLFQTDHGPELNRFFYVYGLVPARFSIPKILLYFSAGHQLFSLVSFMFLHGGFLHLLGNMWCLYIFGDNVEDRLGPFRYLFFYLLCGIASGVSHLILNLNSNVPIIGASGAIAGVMGAYFLLYPKAKILTLIPIFFIPYFIEIPASIFLGIWFLLQFIYASGTQSDVSGIAWWAHVGGFIFGIVLLKVLLAVPASGISHKLRQTTAKKKSNRIQVIRPAGAGNDQNLYGTIVVTPYEAYSGTAKLVSISMGFRKKLFKVVVPSSVGEGTMLRLKGLGKESMPGQRGDLLLKVNIET
jgi:hypothetical protein